MDDTTRIEEMFERSKEYLEQPIKKIHWLVIFVLGIIGSTSMQVFPSIQGYIAITILPIMFTIITYNIIQANKYFKIYEKEYKEPLDALLKKREEEASVAFQKRNAEIDKILRDALAKGNN